MKIKKERLSLIAAQVGKKLLVVFPRSELNEKKVVKILQEDLKVPENWSENIVLFFNDHRYVQMTNANVRVESLKGIASTGKN